MPIFMDVHIIPGVKATEVAWAHQRDIMHQDDHQCKCMTYWIDEERESVFCLVEAPAKEAVEKMHNQAHGLIPNRIIEVESTLVQSFLGRIYDPADATITNDGLKVFADPSFRILLVTKITDPVLLQYKYGRQKAEELLNKHSELIKKNVKQFGGSEAEHAGTGFIISFTSANTAVSCALNIVNDIKAIDGDQLNFRIGIHAGEPVKKSNQLFGDTLQMAQNICFVAGNLQVALTGTVKELVLKDHFQKTNKTLFTLAAGDEIFLQLLFDKLENNWQNAEFNISDFSKEMAMSDSGFYRKTVSLTTVSPNILLKDFRLEKAKEMMQQKRYNIAQVTFESGFSSPSYFTKCFKKKYGILPMAYIELLH